MDVIEIGTLPLLSDMGFVCGRDDARPFAERVFAKGAPRFLRDPDGGLVVFRNADLQTLGAMPQIGSVPPGVLFGDSFTRMDYPAPPPGAEIARVVANQVFTANAPLHRPLRKAFVARLGPRQVAEMEPTARAAARHVLDHLDLSGEVEVMSQIAERLTCHFWGRMLSMDAVEIGAMEGFTRELTRLFYLQRSLDDYTALDTAMQGYWNTIRAAAKRCVARGEDAFVTALAEDLAQIDLPDDPDVAGVVPRDVGALIAGNLIQGYHTAALAAANTLYALLRHPGALRRIISDRHLVTSAIFEALRIEPPVIQLPRWALEDVVIENVRVPRGSVVTLMWGIGGFDPAVFPEPFRFDLDRSRRGSTTFGGGLHICPGRYAAVMLVEVLLDEMLARGLVPTAGTEEPSWYRAHVMGQMQRFPARFTPIMEGVA